MHFYIEINLCIHTDEHVHNYQQEERLICTLTPGSGSETKVSFPKAKSYTDSISKDFFFFFPN